MNQCELSVTISQPLAKFLDAYRKTHAIESESEVTELALELLRDEELGPVYAEASAEIDFAWDVTLKDGL